MNHVINVFIFELIFKVHYLIVVLIVLICCRYLIEFYSSYVLYFTISCLRFGVGSLYCIILCRTGT